MVNKFQEIEFAQAKLLNGVKQYAKDYGLKAFPIPIFE